MSRYTIPTIHKQHNIKQRISANFTNLIFGKKLMIIVKLMASSHTRLKVHDHCMIRSLIGWKRLRLSKFTSH